MKYYLLVFFGVFGVAHGGDDPCKGAGDKANLVYVETLERQAQHEDEDVSDTREIRLVRNDEQVAIEYGGVGITELWEQPVEGQLRLVKYFNAEQRGIEYQPSELVAWTDEADWSAKRQLVSDRLIGRMSQVGSTGEGCDTEVTYELNADGKQIRVIWLPERKVLEQYRVTGEGAGSRLQLASAQYDAAVVDAYFDRLGQYRTTDYADIGDHETDPFLRKMIRHGFVEHGASGFYDAQGNEIGGHSH